MRLWITQEEYLVVFIVVPNLVEIDAVLKFYPHDAMIALVLAVVVCLYVCQCACLSLSHAGIVIVTSYIVISCRVTTPTRAGLRLCSWLRPRNAARLTAPARS